MYLFERLIGITTYISLLFIIIYLIYDSRINYKKLLFIYLLILSILAFFYIPPETEDLYRTFTIVKNFHELDFSKFLGTLFETSYPIAMLFYYIIGKSGIYGLIPCITVFITYGIIFDILSLCKSKYLLNNKQFSIILLFTMSTGMFGYLVTNIRALLALSIVARCFLLEFIFNKKMINNFHYYIISFLIHPLTIFVILLRILYNLFFEKKTKVFTKIILMLMLIISLIIFRNYFKFAYEKFLRYFFEGTYFWIFEFIKVTILNIFLIYIAKLSKKKSFIEKPKNYQIINTSNLLLILMFFIVIFTEFNIYMRVSYFLAILSTPLLCYILKKTENSKNFVGKLFIMSIILLLISCTRGHLSSFKFFLFN